MPKISSLSCWSSGTYSSATSLDYGRKHSILLLYSTCGQHGEPCVHAQCQMNLPHAAGKVWPIFPMVENPVGQGTHAICLRRPGEYVLAGQIRASSSPLRL